MNLNFFALITEIESALAAEHVPGACQWADETFDGAWSAAVVRFETALTSALAALSFEYAKQEGEIYKQTILGLIKKYRDHKKVDDAEQFLLALEDVVPYGQVPVPFRGERQ